MIFYCDDEQDVFIGVCAVDLTEERIVKKVSKITGLDFSKTNSIPDDMEPHAILDFETDTLIVNSKDFNEDFDELFGAGIAIYILP